MSAVGIASAQSLRAQDAGPSAAATPEQTADVAAAFTGLQAQVEQAIVRCQNSVVAIARMRTADPRALELRFDAFNRASGGLDAVTSSDFIPSEYGTGVVVDAEGLILTNYHVVNDPSSQYFVTTADHTTYEATIKGADPRSDLAVLQINATNLAPMPLGNGAEVRRGQFVIALGNPYSLARDGQASASWGIVSNIGRKAGPPTNEYGLPAKQGELRYLGSLIQTDARLNLGTSGGALLNLQGAMVGLTTSEAALAGYEQAAGFAIPVDDTFRRVVELLKQGREVEYGFLGVQPEDLSYAERLRGRAGARIAGVVFRSPAERAGLRPNDVVVSINGVRVYDKDGLFLQIGAQAVEAQVQMMVERNGQVVGPLLAELGKAEVRGGRQIITTPPPSWRGLQVDYVVLASTVNRLEGLPAAEGEDSPLVEDGVRVRQVAPESPAAEAGFEEGMLITHVAGVPVRTPREFFAAVQGRDRDEVAVRLGERSEPPVRNIAPPPSS